MEQLTHLLIQYEGVIYNELKRIGMYRSSQDYEDYYQLGCMKLFESFTTCGVDAFSERYRYQFVKYAGQKIRWAFLDQKRRDRYLIDHEEQDDGFEICLSYGFEENIFFKEQLLTLMELLTAKEKNFLQERFINGLNMSEIAIKCGVSRKTVHAWRNGIQKKAQFLKKG